MKRLLFGWATLALLLGGVVQADYIYTTLDVSILGAFPGSRTQAFGINDAGQIVGSYPQLLSKTRSIIAGFLYSGGAYSRIGVPGSTDINTWPTGINNAGQIVGYYQSNGSGTGPFFGFVFNVHQGTYTTISVPGSPSTQALGINQAGQVVGKYDGHGFLFSAGSYTTLDVPGSKATTAAGINTSGQVVGDYTDTSGKSHGYLLNGGNYTTLDMPDSSSTKATGINGFGQIVGEYNDQFSFVLNNGTYSMVDVPGSTSTFAEGINDLGDIVGYYTDSNGTEHGFLATPSVPELSTLLLLGIGAFGLIAGAWWRRWAIAGGRSLAACWRSVF
jgi:probable HAF family extracellular repeat protein